MEIKNLSNGLHSQMELPHFIWNGLSTPPRSNFICTALFSAETSLLGIRLLSTNKKLFKNQYEREKEPLKPTSSLR